MQTALADRFGGLDRLYGPGALARFSTAHVCVVGVGGVGSWAVEALARSGIGKLTLIDADEACVSNTNRQLHALDGAYGRLKVELLAERVRAINPECQVDARAHFLTTANLREQLSTGFDVVIDACDAFRVKVETIACCRRNKQPLIVVGSAGGRTDPTQIRIRDLSRTERDAMLSLIRKKLRQEFNFPRSPERYFSVPAVYSLEQLRRPQGCASDAGGIECGGGLGAACHLTASFGMVAVGWALERLLKPAR